MDLLDGRWCWPPASWRLDAPGISRSRSSAVRCCAICSRSSWTRSAGGAAGAGRCPGVAGLRRERRAVRSTRPLPWRSSSIPDLRAFRKERGVAEGELIAAGLLPNPQLQVTWLFIQNFTKSLATSGFDVGADWSPPRPGERGGQARPGPGADRGGQGAGRGRGVAARGRRAQGVRRALGGRGSVGGWSTPRWPCRSASGSFVRDKLASGDASRLEANLVDLEYAETAPGADRHPERTRAGAARAQPLAGAAAR